MTSTPLRLLANLTNPLAAQSTALGAKLFQAGLHSRTHVVRDGTIHGWVGKPTAHPPLPLVLLHGFGSDARWQWHKQARAIGATRQLVLPDLLFFGGSRTALPDRSLDVQATTLLQFLDREGIDRFDLGGISYGGLVAWQLAKVLPERIRRLVLVSSPGPAMTVADYQALLRRFEIEHLAELMLPRGPRDVRRLMQAAWHRPPRVPGFALREAQRYFFTEHAAERRALLDSLIALLGDATVDQTPPPQPTLLVWGEHDRVFPVELGERLHVRLGGHARLHVLGGAAHAPNHERAREFNQLLLQFLDDPVPLGGAGRS